MTWESVTSFCELLFFNSLQAVQQDDNGGDPVNCLWSSSWCPGRERREVVWSCYWCIWSFLSWQPKSNVSDKDDPTYAVWAYMKHIRILHSYVICCWIFAKCKCFALTFPGCVPVFCLDVVAFPKFLGPLLQWILANCTGYGKSLDYLSQSALKIVETRGKGPSESVVSLRNTYSILSTVCLLVLWFVNEWILSSQNSVLIFS